MILQICFFSVQKQCNAKQFTHINTFLWQTFTLSNFVFFFLKSCSLPAISFFKVLALAMVTSQELSLQTPQIILFMPMQHKLHFFHNCQSSTSKYFWWVPFFSAVTYVHLLVGYFRFLSNLTFAVNGPFGCIP